MTPMIKQRSWFGALFFVVFATSLSAIVNTEQLRQDAGSVHSLSVSLRVEDGNHDVFSFSPTYRFNTTQGTHRHLLAASYHYGKSKKYLITDRSFLHYRLIQAFTQTHFLEWFIQHQSNVFLNMKHRFLIGNAWRKEDTLGTALRVVYSAGFMLEHEKLQNNSTETRVRLNSYWSVHKVLHTQSVLRFIAYFQPALNHWEDIRILASVSLHHPLTARLQSDLRLDLNSDLMPQPGLKQHDIILTQALTFRW